jgi:hypothetical protein
VNSKPAWRVIAKPPAHDDYFGGSAFNARKTAGIGYWRLLGRERAAPGSELSKLPLIVRAFVLSRFSLRLLNAAPGQQACRQVDR